MNIPASLLPAAWYWAAFALFPPLAAALLWRAPWHRLRNASLLNAWLGAIVALMLLWSLRAGVRPGLELHLLGAMTCTLMFGARLAFAALMLVLAAATLAGHADWTSLPLHGLLLVALPVALSEAIRRAVEGRLANHFFVYVFAASFLGAGAVLFATGAAATLGLAAAGVYPPGYLLREYLAYFVLLAWSEALLSGMAITIMVVYKPQWVTTFDDARYLHGR